MRFPLRKLFLEYSAFAFAAIFNHRYSAWHTPLSFVILVFEIYILVVSSPQLRHYYAARDSCQDEFRGSLVHIQSIRDDKLVHEVQLPSAPAEGASLTPQERFSKAGLPAHNYPGYHSSQALKNLRLLEEDEDFIHHDTIKHQDGPSMHLPLELVDSAANSTKSIDNSAELILQKLDTLDESMTPQIADGGGIQLLQDQFAAPCRYWDTPALLKLPNEILLHIMVMVALEEARVRRNAETTYFSHRLFHFALFQTCCHLRMLAIRNSSYWTLICTRHPGKVLELLQRSGTLPLTIIRPPKTTESWLVEQSDRWRHLSLDIHSGRSLLSSPAPNLRAAHVMIHQLDDPRSPPPFAHLFLGLAPKLRLLRCDFLPRPSDPLVGSLTVLELYDIRMTKQDLVRTFGAFTSLRSLVFKNSRIASTSPGATWPHNAHLGELETLSIIHTTRPSAALRVLAFLMPALSRRRLAKSALRIPFDTEPYIHTLLHFPPAALPPVDLFVPDFPRYLPVAFKTCSSLVITGPNGPNVSMHAQWPNSVDQSVTDVTLTSPSRPAYMNRTFAIVKNLTTASFPYLNSLEINDLGLDDVEWVGQLICRMPSLLHLSLVRLPHIWHFLSGHLSGPVVKKLSTLRIHSKEALSVGDFVNFLDVRTEHGCASLKGLSIKFGTIVGTDKSELLAVLRSKLPNGQVEWGV